MRHRLEGEQRQHPRFADTFEDGAAKRRNRIEHGVHAGRYAKGSNGRNIVRCPSAPRA
ncbi:hypothetical protein Tasa_031_029 [Tanticharoenia sakaeratensis NBRC 103193]|uniref:Uncharacterized protein n=1 Tax=Tanticharoenia sakaeratensis NBRC 103193 TaxID=1231623 RepID=A0A0D6MN01_9PROT|nr:hypothetical protein Tasa_031_029 [Tanticharoenia sakaeratensis NBRC 103193]GBQ21485.1 hypothetical protein AA103193_1744 [Tanticharoenia sakaeratensis NBRC 103193]